jgi:predicted DNA-binding WGR domain protein
MWTAAAFTAIGGVRAGASQGSDMLGQRAVPILLERPGRHGGQAWQYRLRWQDSTTGVVLVREWGVVGSARKRRRIRAYRARGACQTAIDRVIVRLRRRGYRVL